MIQSECWRVASQWIDSQSVRTTLCIPSHSCSNLYDLRRCRLIVRTYEPSQARAKTQHRPRGLCSPALPQNSPLDPGGVGGPRLRSHYSPLSLPPLVACCSGNRITSGSTHSPGRRHLPAGDHLLVSPAIAHGDQAASAMDIGHDSLHSHSHSHSSSFASRDARSTRSHARRHRRLLPGHMYANASTRSNEQTEHHGPRVNDDDHDHDMTCLTPALGTVRYGAELCCVPNKPC